MPGLKDVVKGGWRPEKESWRGDFKGINQMAGWVGKGKGASDSSPHERPAAPLSTLKDPTTFGPPPKNVRYHGSPTSATAAAPEDSPLMSPQTTGQIPVQQDSDLAGDEGSKPGPPPIPSRSTTMSSMADVRPAPSEGADVGKGAVGADRSMTKSKPLVPPRLPPRARSELTTEKPAVLHEEGAVPREAATTPSQTNLGALHRLGQAGISVPEFGIGKRPYPLTSNRNGSSTSPVQSWSQNESKSNPLSSLSSRFSKASVSSADAGSPDQETSFAQKQAALRTASSLQKDPTSVSFADAKAAAITANNFKERHGSQVAQGWKATSRLSDNLGLTPQKNFQEPAVVDEAVQTPAEPPPLGGQSSLKKRPPPPPKKKELSDSTAGAVEPPPIPLASKPQ